MTTRNLFGGFTLMALRHASPCSPSSPRRFSLPGSAASIVVPVIEGTDAFYEFDLTAVPSAVWRGAFNRPPARLTSAWYALNIGRVTIRHVTVRFRTAPERLHRLAPPDRPLDRVCQLGHRGVK